MHEVMRFEMIRLKILNFHNPHGAGAAQAGAQFTTSLLNERTPSHDDRYRQPDRVTASLVTRLATSECRWVQPDPARCNTKPDQHVSIEGRKKPRIQTRTSSSVTLAPEKYQTPNGACVWGRRQGRHVTRLHQICRARLGQSDLE
ncbi:hypothetical protein RRG08_063620 [Elysia crispata]|uniref:Uncharacterized protein n=1 Tax=Elysia crispata TaxID=231223 RepID=A0AAE1DZK3_9GAST|nr:hypothetical protein RRG08_063620 [Elysia crispata]